MEIKNDKNAIWVLKDGTTETLIWQDDLAPGTPVIDLTITEITDTLIAELRQETTAAKYTIYYNQIVLDGTKDQIADEVTEEFRAKITEEVREEMPGATEAEIIAEVNARMAARQPEIQAAIATAVDAYVRGLIETNVQEQINEIKKQNAHKEDLKERATRLAIEPEVVPISTEDDNFIASAEYLPDFLQEKPVFKDATKLLDVLISNYDDETIKQIYQAYCDTIYKWQSYTKLSYGAKLTLLEEKGFKYMLDLLLHMYDDAYEALCRKYDEGEIETIPTYEDFVQQKCDDMLTKITMLFNLLYVLKGRTLGLELALELVGIESYLYMPWNIVATYKGEWPNVSTLPLPGGSVPVEAGDVYSIPSNSLNYHMFNGVGWHPISSIDDYTTPREPFTAELQLYGIESSSLQSRLNTFVRNYMLPKIEVTIRFDAKAEDVLAYPSGAAKLINALLMEDYYDLIGHHHQLNLTNVVSPEHWMYTEPYPVTNITFGIPEYVKRGFSGEVNLSKSYVQDKDGTIHYLYGTTPRLSDLVTGTAIPKIKEDATIDDYDGDYLQVPLERYVTIDIVTGEQQNPHYEGTEFVRDTLIKYYSCLSIEAIHLVKTVAEMEQILIGDFETEWTDYEVWLGRSTELTCESGWNHDTPLATLLADNVAKYSATLLAQYPTLTVDKINDYVTNYTAYIEEETYFKRMRAKEKLDEYEATYPNIVLLRTFPQFFEFTTTTVETREQGGVESTHLVFGEQSLDSNYTGIGDIGILGSNDYFIYNGMLMYHDDNVINQVGDSRDWTDVGASHATSDLYYTPAINNGQLQIIHNGVVVDKTEETDWENITGYINEFYTAFGICDGKLYKLYQNPDFGEEGETYLKYEVLDYGPNWTYLTGAHYSDTYEAYGIKDGQLYKISDERVELIQLDTTRTIQGLTHISEASGVVTYDTLYGQDTIEITATATEITSIIFNGQTQEFTKYGDYYVTENLTVQFGNYFVQRIDVKTDLYTATIGYTTGAITSFELKERADITGWDGDCISRYHHSNSDYTTYGISNGILYSINDENVKILDDSTSHKYTAVCGYYNVNSPRTFAYAICNNQLYEIQGDTLVVKDSSKYWVEIHGCTTATNNFVLGLAKDSASATTGKIYKINAKSTTPEQIGTYDDWISICGRCSTSTAKTATCYGYGVRDISGVKKLYEINKNGVSIVSGFWKVEGTDNVVDLEDYNIHEIKANFPDGTTANTIQEIKESAIYTGMTQTDYDIYVTYDTKGFDNNTRYIVKTDNEDEHFVYIHPSECRTHISEDHCYDLFDVDTSYITGFIQRNFILHGSDIITGNGDAYRFKENETYIELWGVDNHVETDINFTCVIDNLFSPIILDKDNKSGIFYGKYNSQYGIWVKYDNNGTEDYVLVKASPLDTSENLTVRFVGSNTCDVYIVGIGKVFSSSTADNKYVYIPKYLGGNGTIYGDPTIHLLTSFIQGTQYVPLFENGKYLSVETLQENLIETVFTDTSQDTQQVITVQKTNGDILNFSMDELYSRLDLEYELPHLNIYTDYIWNQLQHDPYEGETYATLTYSGAYELNPELISSVPEMIGTEPAVNAISDFENTGLVNNLMSSIPVYFHLNTDFNNKPIYFTTADTVQNQILFATEENEAFTNKYLLKCTTSKVATVGCDTIPSGIIYEFETEIPQSVTRTLIYNNSKFELDENRISNYSRYYFDSYNATLQFYPKYEYDEETETQVYVDDYCTITFKDEEPTASGTMASHTKLKIESNTADEKFMTVDTTAVKTDADNRYYKIDTETVYTGYSTTWLTEVNPEPIPKDQLQYGLGKCWNYSNTSYQILNNIANGLILCIETDDDTSKDQCIFSFGSNSFNIIDNVWALYQNGTITKSNVVAWDSTKTYIKFEPNDTTYDIKLSKDEETWTTVFTEVEISGQMIIGDGNTGIDQLPFNGKIDLARSAVITTSPQRLYDMTQTTIISKSIDGVTYTALPSIVTSYSVNTLTMGHEFTGKLDCYYSEILKSYDLLWVENRTNIDTVIKQEMKDRDPSYDPELDPNVYTIKEYGLELTETPERWDQITITYSTVDKAYYMKPNTEYKIKMQVVEDKDSGKLGVDIVDNPTLTNGVLSDFTNGHAETLLTAPSIVIKFNLTDTTDQALCGYPDTISQCIFIEDGIVKYFDDVDKHELFTAQTGNLYLKLYSTDNYIEYSTDGTTWTETAVSASFSAYDTFNLGVGYVDAVADYFHGSIDLTKSYNEGASKEYLWNWYKKVTPYIYDEATLSWKTLSLEPLLTVNNYVQLFNRFHGTVDMFKSELCSSDTRGWAATQTIIKEGTEVVATVIRDDVAVDTGQTKEKQTVIVDPESLFVHITGVPRVGDKIKLIYNSWYLFREKNETYQFKVLYDTYTSISFNKLDDTEYVIYQTNKQNMVVNTGYQFNGTLSCIDSWRGDLTLCDYNSWLTYRIKYRRYTEDTWYTWTEFIRKKGQALLERMGYDLLGKHYLESSWIKTFKILTSFITYYNYEYITPVGDISFSEDKQGRVTNFSNDAYLQMVMDKLKTGSLIRFWIKTGNDISNQGVSTFVKMEDGYFHSTKDSTQLSLLRKNYTYIEQYRFGGGLLTVKDVDEMPNKELEQVLIKQFATADNYVRVEMLSYNIEGDYVKRVPEEQEVILLPYNPNVEEDEYGYYITEESMAENVHVYYRLEAYNEDPEEVTWIEEPLVKQEIDYFGKTLNVYCAKTKFPHTGFTYYAGDKIQYKLQSNTTTYLTIIPYNDMIVKQKALFYS